MEDLCQERLVTIAIPAYKRRWLGEAIQSAISQDYSKIEILVVDDHSPQNLKEVVAPFLQDSRVKYFYNEKNLGRKSIVLNWNHCLELAHGDFFILLCDDDVLMPNFVSSLLKLATKYPHCNVFHGRRLLKNEITGETIEDAEWPEYETSESFFEHAMLHLRMHTITEFMYRRKHVLSGYHIFPCGFYSDDVSLFEFTEKGGIASSIQTLVLFRTSGDHISSNVSYNWQKAQAAIHYLRWLRQKTSVKVFLESQILRIRRLLYLDFMASGILYRIKFLCVIPSDLYPLRLKISMIKVMFSYWKW